MSACRWDREAEDYLTDDKPCRHDDEGNPTKHCTHRKTCAQHIYGDELTCPRCVGRVRVVIKRIADLAPLMLPAAISAGVDSEAASLAGPGVNPERWSERRVAMHRHLDTWTTLERITEAQHLHAIQAMPDDDEHHPYNVLTRWEFMLREDSHAPRTTPTSVAEAAAYLDRVLHRVAQDEHQDFGLLGREMRKCRNHLEATIRNGLAAERGAPCRDCPPAAPCREHEIATRKCPNCRPPAPRLVRKYGHWCLDEDCENIHYADDSGDTWVCPRDKDHWWTPAGYADLLKERAESRRIAAV